MLTKPDFYTLEELPSHPERRLVDGTWMDQEQYDVEGWHVVGEYDREDGTKTLYWKATLDGLQRYSQIKAKRRQDRHETWKARQEADDQWSSEIQQMIDDQKPGGYVSRRPER